MMITQFLDQLRIILVAPEDDAILQESCKADDLKGIRKLMWKFRCILKGEEY